MRIVIVRPKEKSFLPVFLEPLESVVGDQGCAALSKNTGDAIVFDQVPHVVVVGRETVCEAELSCQDTSANETGRRETIAMSDGRKGWMRFIQDKPFHTTQLMERRIFTGHDRGVRWQCEWDLRRRMGEEDTPGRKGVEVWRLGSLSVTSRRLWTGITAQVIGACSVECNEEDIAVGLRRGGVKRFFGPTTGHRKNQQKTSPQSSETFSSHQLRSIHSTQS